MGIDITGTVEGNVDVSKVEFGFSIKISLFDAETLIGDYWGVEIDEDEYEGVLGQIVSDTPSLLDDYMDFGEFDSCYIEMNTSVDRKKDGFIIYGGLSYDDSIPFVIDDFESRLRTWEDDVLDEIRSNNHFDFDFGDFSFNQRQFTISQATIEGETDMGDEFNETY